MDVIDKTKSDSHMSITDFSFQDIVEHASDAVVVTRAEPITDKGPEIVYVNKAFTELTEYTREETVGKTPRLFYSDHMDDDERAKIRVALEKKHPVKAVLNNRSKHGREYWVELSILPLKNSDGEVTHFAAIERDVTGQKCAEAKLEEVSKSDSLTGLLNRGAFEDVLLSEFSRFQRGGQNYACVMMDVDLFKEVNDTYGHNAGDHALRLIVDRCQSKLRKHDVFARVGGEEFCILLPGVDLRIAKDVAEKLRTTISKSRMAIGKEFISLTASFGVSLVTQDDSRYFDIYARSDERLDDAKKAGRNCVVG